MSISSILIKMFASATDHIVVVVIYNCLFLLSFHFPAVLGKCLSWSCFLAWWGDHTFIPSGSGSLAVFPVLFPLTLITVPKVEVLSVVPEDSRIPHITFP